jgi:hypothetical protein
LPPAAWQAAASFTSEKPLPLQAFRPLHELLAVLQALCPLQALAPMHFTAASAEGATRAMVPAEKNAAAAAATARVVVRFMNDTPCFRFEFQLWHLPTGPANC